MRKDSGAATARQPPSQPYMDCATTSFHQTICSNQYAEANEVKSEGVRL